MPQNKFILLIVEGKSDDTFYGEMLARYNEDLNINLNSNIRIKVTHGDVLTKKSHKSSKELVTDIFKKYKKDNSLETIDFIKLIQICDIDGSYFSDNMFQINNTRNYISGKTYDYSQEQKKIYVKSQNKYDTLRRQWNLKKQRQNELRNTAEIEGVPYQIFYVSLFLEHFLTNKIIVDPEEKDDCIDTYLDNKSLKQFRELLNTRSLSDDYVESWEKLDIRLDKYAPCSNINILFDSLDINRE